MRQYDAHKLVTQSVSIEFQQYTKKKENPAEGRNWETIHWIRVEQATEESYVGTLETSSSKFKTMEFTKKNMTIY